MTKRQERMRSAIWAAAISIPLCLWGSHMSMALAHGGGLLIFLFLPIFPVMLLFGSGGLLGTAPDWLFNALAVAAEFFGTFGIVHLIRMARAKRHDNGT